MQKHFRLASIMLGNRRLPIDQPGQVFARVVVPARCVVSLRHFHARAEPVGIVLVCYRRRHDADRFFVRFARFVLSFNTAWRNPMTLSTHLQPIVALIAGVLILIMPRLLNFIVAIYLILVGIIGLGIIK